MVLSIKKTSDSYSLPEGPEVTWSTSSAHVLDDKGPFFPHEDLVAVYLIDMTHHWFYCLSASCRLFYQLWSVEHILLRRISVDRLASPEETKHDGPDLQGLSHGCPPTNDALCCGYWSPFFQKRTFAASARYIRRRMLAWNPVTFWERSNGISELRLILWIF